MYDFSHIVRATDRIKIEVHVDRSLMTSLPPVSLKMRRSILIIELFALAFSIWCNLGSPHLQRSPFKIELIALLVIAITPFIVIVPVDRPLWQRRIYILSAILTIIIAEHFQVYIYLFCSTFLLKGCFLLPRLENIAIAIFFQIIATYSYTLRAPEIIENLIDGDMRLYLNLSRMIPNYLASNLGNCIYK